VIGVVRKLRGKIAYLDHYKRGKHATTILLNEGQVTPKKNEGHIKESANNC
jgi:hypothetical protein